MAQKADCTENKPVREDLANEDVIEVHTVQSVLSRTSQPFRTTVKLIDNDRKETEFINAIVDDGAMVAAIDTGLYEKLRKKIDGWGRSTRRMRMANGELVLAEATWTGKVQLKGLEVDGSFEVFDSGGSWQLLFGKPLLEQFKAVHEYTTDTIKVSDGKTARTVFN
ncbi:hypothetical protein K435DRAFT_661880, partial [Dendrothele bispora CBS 962.96]